jgi:hypothetical protein
MEAMAHRNRGFSQLHTSIYKGFSMAMLNNQMVIQEYIISPNGMLNGISIMVDGEGMVFLCWL